MRTQTRIGIIILIVVIIIAGFFAVKYYDKSSQPASNIPVATVLYTCDANKTITADYYNGESKPRAHAGEPPIPGGSVALKLSDGRTMTLPQTISADGTRYANADESFVFWGKGNGALVLENNQQKSYIGCVETPRDPGGLPQVYHNTSDGFLIRYPVGFNYGEHYKYTQLGPGKEIAGVLFNIPASLASGTNLGADSYVSVEEIPHTNTCSARLFIYPGVVVHEITEGNTTYSVASSTDAGAGNRYEETVYAISGTNPCIAVRYFIHYSVFENYPPGTIKEFDKQALLNQFDAMRRTLTVLE